MSHAKLGFAVAGKCGDCASSLRQDQAAAAGQEGRAGQVETRGALPGQEARAEGGRSVLPQSQHKGHRCASGPSPLTILCTRADAVTQQQHGDH